MSNLDNLLPEGLADRLPESAARITRAMRACLGVLDSHGYDRVRPPLLEFERSLGSRAEGIETRNMFRFVDPVSLRTLALRGDITPQIGRIAATSMAQSPRPLRLAYCGDTAVIKADQLDPARERLKLGGELIGSDSAEAAGEIVAVAIEALAAAGLTGISVDFTLPDLVDTLAKKAMPLDADQIDDVRRELDTKDAGGLKAAGGDAYLPLLFATGPFENAVSKLEAVDAGGALASRIEGLKTIAERIGGSARITLDPSERHGFEYQSWFGFTIYAEGVRGAAGRGGTYRIGGSDEAATGFTLYVDTLADAAPEAEAGDTVYLPTGHDPLVASQLRAEGKRTVAQISGSEDPAALGCTHRLDGTAIIAL